MSREMLILGKYQYRTINTGTSNPVFPTEINLLEIIPTEAPVSKDLIPSHFDAQGNPIYGKSANGYIWWDVCTCVECLAQDEESEVEVKKQKKRSLPNKS